MFLHYSAEHHENSIAHGNYMIKFLQTIQTSKTNTVKHQKTVHHIRKNIEDTAKMCRQSITVVHGTDDSIAPAEYGKQYHYAVKKST